MPLKEWALTDPGLRPIITYRNSIFRAIMGTWRNCQNLLLPIQSPLPSFMYHPGFKKVTKTSRFERWRHAGMGKWGS